MQLKPKLLSCLIQWDMKNLLKIMVRNSLHLLRVLTIKKNVKNLHESEDWQKSFCQGRKHKWKYAKY